MLFLLGSYSAPITLWKLLNSGEFEFVNSIPSSGIKGTKSPSWICRSSCGKYYYSANEGEESISSYMSVHQNGVFEDLQLLTTSGAEGMWPCHLTICPGGILVANYGSGTLTLVPIGNNGELRKATEVIDHNIGRSRVSHVHHVVSHPQYPDVFYVCDLGLDSIMTYRLSNADTQTHRLVLIDAFVLPTGSGPRHVALHPNGSFAYVVNELSNTVCVLSINSSTRSLSTESNQSNALQLQSCLPGGASAEPNTMGAAEILLSRSGKYLYISNRCIEDTKDTSSVMARSTVTVFAVLDEGARIQQIQSICTQGIHPRHMCLICDDTRLCVANKVSSNLVTFSVDAESGRIDESSAVISDCRTHCPDPNFIMPV